MDGRPPCGESAVPEEGGAARLTFDRVQVQVDVTFWMELRQRKVTDWKLHEPFVPVTGTPTAVVTLTNAYGSEGGLTVPPASDVNDVVFSRDSFTCDSSGDVGSTASAAFVRGVVPGVLKSVNVLQDLANMDTNAALFAVLQEKLLAPLVLDRAAIGTDAREANEADEAELWRSAPFLLFAMYVYVDAKNYAFHHREAFPVMSLDSPLLIDEAETNAGVPPSVADAIRRHGVSRIRTYGPSCLYSAFLCVVQHGPDEDSSSSGGASDATLAFAEFSPSRYARLSREAGPKGKVLICFWDVSTAAVATTLGWPLRNFLLCLRLCLPTLTRVALFALHDGGRGGFLECTCSPLGGAAEMVTALRSPSQPPAFLRLTGWRKTSVHVANISTHMDPASLAEEGSRLNLELMKWRQLPSLDLEGLAGCRALLLGTGTLGCNVARGLLMWGVRHLTLVDRGTVHYSNLARQTLFTAEDAAQMGREKTVAAAAALRAILPGVTAVPVTMTIHMPGHRTDPAHAAETRAEVERLDGLIRDHDVVFLLTDSWEARWLPTVLAAAHNVPLINVALGFDTYVVMRHGLTGSDVRCYFCSDVAAPTDSRTARTLDQQCTVTRPGVSGVAAALAVELLAAMYQQSPPLGKCKCGDGHDNSVAESCRLGVVPEQIRGSVFTHETTLLTGKRNPHCTACSPGILDAYRKEGSSFLLRCLDDPAYIESVSGLSASKALWETQNADADWSFHSSSSGGSNSPT